jgi:hypothetical protein
MDRMLSYSKTAMERAMKVEEVISRAKGEKDHGMATEKMAAAVVASEHQADLSSAFNVWFRPD